MASMYFCSRTGSSAPTGGGKPFTTKIENTKIGTYMTVASHCVSCIEVSFRRKVAARDYCRGQIIVEDARAHRRWPHGRVKWQEQWGGRSRYGKSRPAVLRLSITPPNTQRQSRLHHSDITNKRCSASDETREQDRHLQLPYVTMGIRNCVKCL